MGRLKKDLKDFSEKVERLNSLIDPQVIAKAKMYDYYKDSLEYAMHCLKVASIVEGIDDYGRPNIVINLKLNPVFLNFDEKNELIVNKQFRALNRLDLVSPEDCVKVQSKIDAIKKKKK